MINPKYSIIFLLLSLVALVFLVYTLVNLNKLGINVTHPRVLVELALFILFMMIGILLKLQK